MGRGRGSSGGHSSGGGHHVSRHSSGGHRVNSGRSSSRSYSSSSHNSSRSYGYGGSPGYRHYGGSRTTVVHNHYGSSGGSNYNSGGYSTGGGCLTYILAGVAMVLIMFAIGTFMVNIGKPSTSILREAIENPPAFNNNCIIDETGEFDNPTRVATYLRTFYTKTGVQPFIIWKDYDASLRTDEDKVDWAEEWYDTNLDTQNVFLYVYFENEYDYGDGYMCYVNGTQSTSVMDAEAVSVFWNYIDRYWEQDISTDTLFQKVFANTASVIMAKPSNIFDAIRVPLILLGIGVVILSTNSYLSKRARIKHQEAEDAERILNAPVHPIGEGCTDAATEAAVNKYSQD